MHFKSKLSTIFRSLLDKLLSSENNKAFRSKWTIAYHRVFAKLQKFLEIFRNFKIRDEIYIFFFFFTLFRLQFSNISGESWNCTEKVFDRSDSQRNDEGKALHLLLHSSSTRIKLVGIVHVICLRIRGIGQRNLLRIRHLSFCTLTRQQVN